MEHARTAARSVALLRSGDYEGVVLGQQLVSELGAGRAVLLPASPQSSSASTGVQDARQAAGTAWLAFAIKKLQDIPASSGRSGLPSATHLEDVLVLAHSVLTASLAPSMTDDETTAFQLFARNIVQSNSKVYAQALLAATEASSPGLLAESDQGPSSGHADRASFLPVLMEALSRDLRRVPPTYRPLGSSVRALATYVLFPPSLSPDSIPPAHITEAAALVLIDLHRTGSTARPADPAEAWPTAASSLASTRRAAADANEPKTATAYPYLGTDPVPAEGSTASTTSIQQAAGRMRNPTPTTLWSATIDAALGTIDVYLSSLSSTLTSSAIVPAWGSTFPLGPAASPPQAVVASPKHVKGLVQLLRHALYALLIMLSAPAPAVVARLPLVRMISWLASPLGPASVLGVGIRAAAKKLPSPGTDAALFVQQVNALPTLQMSALLLLDAFAQRAGPQGSLTFLGSSAPFHPRVGTTPPVLDVLAGLLPSNGENVTEVHLTAMRLIDSFLSPPVSVPLGPDHPTVIKVADVCQALVAYYLVRLPTEPKWRMLGATAAQLASEILARLAPLLAAASPDPATTSAHVGEKDEPPRAPRAVNLAALATAGVRTLVSPSAVTFVAPPALLTAMVRMLSASLQTAPGAVWAATAPGLAGLLSEVHSASIYAVSAQSPAQSREMDSALHELRATLALVVTPRLVPVPEWGSDAAMEALLADVVDAHVERIEEERHDENQDEEPRKKRQMTERTQTPPAFPAASPAQHWPVSAGRPGPPTPVSAPAPEPAPATAPLDERKSTTASPTVSENQETTKQHTDLTQLTPRSVHPPQEEPGAERDSGHRDAGASGPQEGARTHKKDVEHLPPPQQQQRQQPAAHLASHPPEHLASVDNGSSPDSDSDLPDLDAAPPSDDEMAWS